MPESVKYEPQTHGLESNDARTGWPAPHQQGSNTTGPEIETPVEDALTCTPPTFIETLPCAMAA